MKVVVDRESFTETEVLSSIPQGTVFGTIPVLRAADVAGAAAHADAGHSPAKKRRAEGQTQASQDPAGRSSSPTEAGQHFVDFTVRPWAESSQDVDPRVRAGREDPQQPNVAQWSSECSAARCLLGFHRFVAHRALCLL